MEEMFAVSNLKMFTNILCFMSLFALHMNLAFTTLDAKLITLFRIQRRKPVVRRRRIMILSAPGAAELNNLWSQKFIIEFKLGSMTMKMNRQTMNHLYFNSCFNMNNAP